MSVPMWKKGDRLLVEVEAQEGPDNTVVLGKTRMRDGSLVGTNFAIFAVREVLPAPVQVGDTVLRTDVAPAIAAPVKVLLIDGDTAVLKGNNLFLHPLAQLKRAEP